ncbi:MAG: ABC transporter substrate-binding protein [Deltaproteobacteria bacterium]|nr:ABC transporter substrate-binding protein [Deltaproteobacteria bacterium]MBI2538994.1 ABC transporter substrate-binding protein [Deltaproteobacteria bacterium]MBI2991276.1 ABC transporter substrate-binding protein [Deltaproteobacteria bacterium]
MARLFWIIAVPVLLFAPSVNGARAASAPAKMVIAHAAMNARVLPLWAAKDQGFFSKYGVPADMIFIRQAPTLVQALTSGDIQVGYTGGTAVLGAAAGGSDLKILAAFTNRVTYDVVARPGIKTPEDLRGKIFGVQSIGGTLWMGAILALEHFGLDPNRDTISLIAAGDQSVLAQALLAGSIDVTVLDGVMSRTLREKGYPVLAELSKVNIPISSVGIVARGGYIQKNPQAIENLLKALLESQAFLFGPSNKAAALAILKRYLRINDQQAEEGYKDVLNGLDRKPHASLAGLKNVQRLMKLRNPSVEKVKVEELVDDRFMKKLDQNGFIDEMYAKYGVK